MADRDAWSRAKEGRAHERGEEKSSCHNAGGPNLKLVEWWSCWRPGTDAPPAAVIDQLEVAKEAERFGTPDMPWGPSVPETALRNLPRQSRFAVVSY